MLAKCTADNIYGISKNKKYIILCGKYSSGYDKQIESIRIINDDEGLIEYSSEYFDISAENENKYVFNSEDNTFCFNSIAYPEFLSMLYEDRPEYISDYIKAKEDLKTAKYFLYSEYSYDDLKERICSTSPDNDEYDFIFQYLRDKKMTDLLI